MLYKRLIVFACLTALVNVRAQQSTSYGKFGFGVEGLVNTPLLSGNFSGRNYTQSGDQMKATLEWFNFGANAYFLRKMNRQYSIGFGAGIKQFLVASPEYFVSTTVGLPDFEMIDTTWLRMESWSYQTTTGLLLAEFYPKKGVGLIGFSHRVGLGFSLTKPGFKSYQYSLNEYGKDDADNWTLPDTYMINRESLLSYKSVTMFYGVQLRYPVSRHLTFDMGVSYLLNIYLRPAGSQLNLNTSPPLNFSDNFSNVQRENLVSLNLKGGITVLF